MSPLFARLIRWALPLVLLQACSAPPDKAVDLLTLPPTSRVVTGAIEFGTPQGQQSLPFGWPVVRGRVPDDQGWKCTGERADVRFALLLPEAVKVSGELTYAGSQSCVVKVGCNDKQVGAITLTPGPQSFELLLPQSVVNSGTNLLSLSLPSGARSQITWRRMLFSPAAEAARVQGETLVLAPGGHHDFYFRAPASAVLRATARFQGPQDRLRIVLTATGLEPSETSVAEGPFTFTLAPETAGKICRLSFEGNASEVSLDSPFLSGQLPPSSAPASPSAKRRPPRILMVCVDTLRDDVTRGAQASTPLLNKRDFATFAAARAPSSFTMSTISSVFTGRDVVHHGVRAFVDQVPEDLVTLAESLRAEGYRTIGFSANPWLDAQLGYGQGFDQYEVKQETADLAVDRAIASLEANKDESALFLYLHLIDPHEPYAPPRGFRPPGIPPGEGSQKRVLEVAQEVLSGHGHPRALEHLRQLYLGEVKFTDQQLERLWSYLESIGRYDDALIVFFADHGEQFGEHRYTRHGNSLYGPVMRVPLRMKLPKDLHDLSLPLASPTELIDIMPTVLAIAKVPSVTGMDGQDLTAVSPSALADRVSLGYLENGTTGSDVWLRPWSRRYESAAANGYLLQVRGWDTVAPERPLLELFDHNADPDELVDLSSRGGVEMGFLWSRILQARRDGVMAPSADERAVKEAFDSLPYLR